MNDYQLIQSFSTFLNFIQLIKDKFVYKFIAYLCFLWFYFEVIFSNSIITLVRLSVSFPSQFLLLLHVTSKLILRPYTYSAHFQILFFLSKSQRNLK